MKRIGTMLLILATVMAFLPAVLPVSADTADSSAAVPASAAAPAAVITEVCFNPTFYENDLELSKTEDVLEYVEIYNHTDAELSLADCTLRYARGYGAEEYSENPVISTSDNPRVIAPGETAVFVCYQDSSALLGYGYATDGEIRAYYDFFCEFYGCGDRVPLRNFYVMPRVESGTSEKLAGGFNLANSHPESLLRLMRGEEILAECFYSAERWNKNNTAVNMMWYEGMDAEHPLASLAVNTAGCTPGYLYASQVPTESLIPAADALPIKVMEYNLQAEAKKQTAADGSAVTDEMRTEKIFATIAAHDPDVLVLTEINYRWLGLLDPLIGEGGKYSAYGRSAKGKYHDGTQLNEIWDLTSLVLWKTDKFDCLEKDTFWCSAKPTRPGSATWPGGLTGDMPRAINWVILEDKETGAQFFFAGAHLDAKSGEIRGLSTSLIAEMIPELAKGLPAMITGDFNCSDNSQPYANIHGTDLYDARYLVPTYGSMTIRGTYNKFGENTDMQVRLPIDLCFVTPATVWVESAHTDFAFVDEGESVYASDHNAIVFDMKIQKLRTVGVETETETAEETTAATAPETAPTTDMTETEAETEASGETSANPPSETTPEDSGCGSVLPVSLLSLLIPAAICLSGRSRKQP